MRMRSGRVRICNSRGTSPIHMSFAKDNQGIWFRRRAEEHGSQTFARKLPQASVCIEPWFQWRSIPSVRMWAGCGFMGDNLFFFHKSDTVIAQVSLLWNVPAQTAQTEREVALFPVALMNFDRWSWQQWLDTGHKNNSSSISVVILCFLAEAACAKSCCCSLGNWYMASSIFVQDCFLARERAWEGKAVLMSFMVKDVRTEGMSMEGFMSVRKWENCTGRESNTGSSVMRGENSI